MFQTIQKTREALGLPERTVVLTFDDGPVPNGQTSHLLDLLATEEIRAVFCLVGRRIPGNEIIVRRIHEEGHLISNHGDRHRLPDRLSNSDFLLDLDAFDGRVAEALAQPGWTSTSYRPPGGRWNARLQQLLEKAGKTVMPISYFAWDIMPFPFRRRLILAGMLAHLRKQHGGLFLLHEAMVPLNGERLPAPARSGRAWVITLVQEFIQTAKQEGFKFANPHDIDWNLANQPFGKRSQSESSPT